MARHPYSDLDRTARWRTAVAEVAELDPMIEAPFRIGGKDAVVTAGSCFAQHIGRYLQSNGLNYLVTEPAHPMVGEAAAKRLGYGIYSARYGNVYTPRQLVQLFDRAYGRFAPAEDVWHEADGTVVDPFRPRIQPGGFNGEVELTHDRARHFRAVREAFERLDVFVFTFGLTEAWRSRIDGAVYPLCPGVSGGTFDPARHELVNFDVDAVVADGRAFLERLRSVNPKARVVVTVSPVPLVATAEPRHVLVSTVYSKSVLRVACDVLAREAGVAYFPAYEIVASGHAGDYWAADRRSVTKEGVEHVMRVFDRHFVKRTLARQVLDKTQSLVGSAMGRDFDVVRRAIDVMCDEEALDLLESDLDRG